MKCPVCKKEVQERPGAQVYHMQCARDISVEIRKRVMAGWPARAEKGNESWLRE